MLIKGSWNGRVFHSSFSVCLTQFRCVLTLTFYFRNTGHGGGTISPLAVNTMNHHNLAMTIKSEPLSPPRDSTTSSNHHILRPPSTGQNHLSPGHINHSHSNNSSPTGISHSLDYDGPMLKRPRVDHGAWAT